MLDERVIAFDKSRLTMLLLPMAIFVFNKPMIQTRSGVRTAVCSIDVLSGMIRTGTNEV